MALEATRRYGLQMPGLYSAIFSDSEDPQERWVKLTFVNLPTYHSMSGKIRESLKPYHTMSHQSFPFEYSLVIKVVALKAGDVYQIKSAIQIIHFLNKEFDTQMKPIPVLSVEELVDDEEDPHMPALVPAALPYHSPFSLEPYTPWTVYDYPPAEEDDGL